MSYRTNDYRKVAVRTAAILTNAYVAAAILDTNSDGSTENLECSYFNQLVVLTSFTAGSLTDLRVKIEFSPDGTTWYQETLATVSQSGGTSTESVGEHVYAATGNYRALLPITDRYIRISAKGTGTVTSSSVQIDAVLGKV